MRDRLWSAPRRGYHHGNLRETLIEAARHLIAVNGPEGFSLIEAARLAEVSPAAPYRHFPDRNALVAAVRARGFELFAERLQAAAAGTQDATVAFRRMGAAYLAFAREEPGFYGAMFEARKSPEQGAPPAGSTAFEILADAVRRVVQPGQLADSGLRLLALQVWAAAHGVAMLGRSGDLPSGERDPRAEDILDGMVSAIIRACRADAESGRGAGPAPGSSERLN